MRRYLPRHRGRQRRAIRRGGGGVRGGRGDRPWRSAHRRRRARRPCSPPPAICGSRRGEPGKAALALDRALAGTGLAGRAARRGLARPCPRRRSAERSQDRARQGQRGRRRSIGRGPVPVVFLGRAGDPREQSRRGQDRDRPRARSRPRRPTILFEAGHVAHLAGDDSAGAPTTGPSADRFDTNGAVGKAAREALLCSAAAGRRRRGPAEKARPMRFLHAMLRVDRPAAAIASSPCSGSRSAAATTCRRAGSP